MELGHFYPEDFQGGAEALVRQFRRITPWVDRARLAALGGVRDDGLRVSTCLLVDDYSEREALPPPSTVVPELLAAAEACGLVIDYIARESACADEGRFALAPMVERVLIPDPPYGTNGSRPPVHESGWLCNGSRSPATTGLPAMGAATSWKPPRENASRRHSVFLDVELRDDSGETGPRWSCAFLAAIWQLLRLGLLRAR
ncbi:SCO2522 family protein, partial [Frankia sp. EI5c]|uniref:SCO2522 family protein n=1 Tax=Frankia sp. EI5c TaxID=683316 RepID=UPI0037BF4473